MRKDIENLLKLVPEMKKRFEDAARHYGSLSGKAAAAVVRWEWCTGQRYSHQPFGVERFDGKRGRILNKEPEKKTNKYRYGFSSDGRVLVEERYADEVWKAESFWEYSQGRINSTLFDHEPHRWVINVESTFFENGLAGGFIRFAQGGLRVEAYEYRKGQLVCVHEAAREHNPGSLKH